MLTKANYIYGVKKNNESIESNVKSIIDNAQSYLVMGSYSFWMPKPLYDSMKAVSSTINSALLIPHVNRSGDVITKLQTIQNLINNANVGVIISGLNHSKFVFNENSIYYGSANLTDYGLNSNIEAVTVYDSIRNDLKADFIDFVQIEINRYLNAPAPGIPIVNNMIISSLNTLFSKTNKLNPNITKVVKTVNNFEECNGIISKAIDTYFAILSFTDFRIVYKKLLVLRRNLEELYKYGSYILIKEGYLEKNDQEEVDVEQGRVNRYNALWSEFDNQLKNTISLLERLPDNIRMSPEKDELSVKNTKIITELKGTLKEEYNNMNIE